MSFTIFFTSFCVNNILRRVVTFLASAKHKGLSRCCMAAVRKDLTFLVTFSTSDALLPPSIVVTMSTRLEMV